MAVVIRTVAAGVFPSWAEDFQALTLQENRLRAALWQKGWNSSHPQAPVARWCRTSRQSHITFCVNCSKQKRQLSPKDYPSCRAGHWMWRHPWMPGPVRGPPPTGTRAGIYILRIPGWFRQKISIFDPDRMTIFLHTQIKTPVWTFRTFLVKPELPAGFRDGI